MSQCSFCGSKENHAIPLCHSCGSLRYPVATKPAAKPNSRQDKLKLSATLAVAVVTPGAFIVLALVGVNKIKNRL
ncbi:MAG: hypothetical protein GQ532_08475 [Methylomarinum sp.]|nr:hypothetical protein [Methylomarinum sp.]